jgi:putative SOS response-associated peptidase YedK
MCGRYVSKANRKDVEQEFDLALGPEQHLQVRYNIAPTQIIPVILESKGQRIIEQLRWGLIPGWAKDETIGAKLINGRAETLAEKPSFKNAFRSRRCIIPASGFYEWQKATSPKQPFYFYLKDKPVFGFAGLYDEWLHRETGELIETCTIITTEANELLEPVHERMPVILPRELYDEWLDENERDTRKLQSLLRPYPAAEMASYPVSRSVNFAQTDSEELIKPLNSL